MLDSVIDMGIKNKMLHLNLPLDDNYIPSDSYEKLCYIAKQHGISVRKLVSKIIRLFLAKKIGESVVDINYSYSPLHASRASTRHRFHPFSTVN